MPFLVSLGLIVVHLRAQASYCREMTSSCFIFGKRTCGSAQGTVGEVRHEL